VQGKAGKHTHGVGWFYSSIAGKVIRAISHHVISLVDTEQESSFVLKSRPTVRPTETAPKKKQAPCKKSRSKSPAKKDKTGR
jgi:hypothetical protein